MLLKGFIDLQVNGYLGIDFSEPGLTLSDIRRVTRALVERGTIAYCPTVITGSVDTYKQNLPVLAQAMEEPDLQPHLLGIHLEGPFISPEEGARGAHPRRFTREPDIDLFEQLLAFSKGKVSIVTVAPELPGAGDLIRCISGHGIRVFLGHHLAGPGAIEKACRAGATASTHLGNGLPNILPRHLNPLWDQLAEDQLTALLITDGHHLPDNFIRVVSKVKAPERLAVTSDSAPIAGLPPGRYNTLGQEVLLEESGRLWNPVGQHLVGSSSCMMQCMNYLAALDLMGEEELYLVGYHNPLRLLGRELSSNDRFSQLPSLSYEAGIFSLS